MRTSKLVKILKTLSAEELKGLHRYIQSPYFNKSKEAIQLFNHIRKYAPNYTSSQLEKRKLFSKLFPSQSYSDSKLRNLFTKLYRIVENYLIQIHYEQDDFGKKKLLASIFKQRHYHVAFQKSSQQLLDLFEEQPFRDASYFYETFYLQKQLYFNQHSIQEGKQLHYLAQALSNLKVFSTLEQLKLQLEFQNLNQLYKDTSQLSSRSTNKISPNPLIVLFQNLLLLLKNGTEELYYTTKQIFLDNLQKIRHEDAQDILMCLLNWTIKKQSGGDEIKYVKESFYLYKFGISQYLLCTKEEIHETTYLNIVSLGAYQKEFTWVDQFINQYATKIVGSAKEDIQQLSNAFYYFYQQNYDAAIQILTTNKFKISIYELHARLLSIKIYYELFEQDSTYDTILQAHFERFNKFLIRATKLSPDKILIFQNFLKLLKTIYSNKKVANKNSKAKLVSLLEQEHSISSRNWLKQKIEAI